MSFFLQVFYSIFSALIFALALPNEILKFGSPVFGIVALVPFYIAISNSTTFKRASVITMIQTFCVHVFSSFWLYFFKSAGIITLGSSAVGTSLLSSLFGSIFFMPKAFEVKEEKLAVTAGLHVWRLPFRVFWFAASYVIWEWVKSTGFLGYPWGTLSTTVFKWRFIMQIASITGTYGVTFIFALFAALAGEAVMFFGGRNSVSVHTKKSLLQTFYACSAFFLISSVFGIYQMCKPRTPIKKMNAVFVQQNFDPWTVVTDTQTILTSQEMSIERIDEFKSHGKKTDVVVWSEGVLLSFFPRGIPLYSTFPMERPLLPFIKECGTPFIIGGGYVLNSDEYKYQNAAFFFNGDGTVDEKYYAKIHLVPFAEAIPFMDTSKKFRAFVIKNFGFAGWTPGNECVNFEIFLNETGETVKASVPICYDDAFPEVMTPLWKSGSEVFLNMSDDSWSQKISSEIQHAVVSSYRAIECRTTLARSTNAGYSVIFDPCARILDDMPLFESTSKCMEIPIYSREITPYLIFGNWLVAFCIIFVAAFSIYLIFFKKSENYEDFLLPQ